MGKRKGELCGFAKLKRLKNPKQTGQCSPHPLCDEYAFEALMLPGVVR